MGNWVHSAQDRNYWRALVHAALKLWVPQAMEGVSYIKSTWTPSSDFHLRGPKYYLFHYYFTHNPVQSFLLPFYFILDITSSLITNLQVMSCSGGNYSGSHIATRTKKSIINNTYLLTLFHKELLQS